MENTGDNNRTRPSGNPGRWLTFTLVDVFRSVVLSLMDSADRTAEWLTHRTD